MSIKLLIVDDSELIRASLINLFEHIEGVDSIDQAATLTHALVRVSLQSPDIVILDLHLPDGLGLDIIQSMKQLVPSLRVAVLTIHADHNYRRKCLERGSDWFFDKATEFDGLLEVVRQLASSNADQSASKSRERPFL